MDITFCGANSLERGPRGKQAYLAIESKSVQALHCSELASEKNENLDEFGNEI